MIGRFFHERGGILIEGEKEREREAWVGSAR